MSAILTFLGGSAFRAIWGEISSFIKNRQEHRLEMERMRLQAELEEAQHQRNLDSIRVQHQMGVETIRVQSEAAAEQGDIDAFTKAVEAVGKTTGIKFIDVWNGAVRPALATMALVAVIAEIYINGWKLTEWDRELIGAILGVYVADRSLRKRGK